MLCVCVYYGSKKKANDEMHYAEQVHNVILYGVYYFSAGGVGVNRCTTKNILFEKQA